MLVFLMLLWWAPVDAPEPEPEPGECVAWECFGDARGQWVQCSCVGRAGGVEL